MRFNKVKECYVFVEKENNNTKEFLGQIPLSTSFGSFCLLELKISNVIYWNIKSFFISKSKIV